MAHQHMNFSTWHLFLSFSIYLLLCLPPSLTLSLSFSPSFFFPPSLSLSLFLLLFLPPALPFLILSLSSFFSPFLSFSPSLSLSISLPLWSVTIPGVKTVIPGTPRGGAWELTNCIDTIGRQHSFSGPRTSFWRNINSRGGKIWIASRLMTSTWTWILVWGFTSRNI